MRDPTAIEALRALPGAAPVFDALAGAHEVHVVGGAVRDLRLGRRPSELDLVVVGDAVGLADRVAARLGARVRVHERFRTATLEFEGRDFDFASARRERYPRPGALPAVELGASLAEDLERRDFTVNAIAVSLADGAITAHPRALDDLRARVLRVLHPASFHDDPTRLIRLARYAGRLSLTVEASTAALVDSALAGGALDTVSGERIGRELRLAAGEPQPATLGMLFAMGVGSAVLGEARFDEGIVGDALASCPPDGGRDLLALAAAVCGQDAAALAHRLRHLAFTRAQADRIVRAATAAPGLARELDRMGGGPPSRVAALLAREPVEGVALAAALSRSAEAKDAAARFLGESRHVRTLVSGHDLERAGLRGAEVGRGLAAARAAAIDSPGAGRESQLVAALAAVGREPPSA